MSIYLLSGFEGIFDSCLGVSIDGVVKVKAIGLSKEIKVKKSFNLKK